MRSQFWWRPLPFAVVVAVAILLLDSARAANKNDVDEIVQLINAGNQPVALAAAIGYPAKNPGIGPLMAGFKLASRGGLLDSGIEQTLIKLSRDEPAQATLAKADYRDLGATVSALGMICGAMPAPKAPKAAPADWSRWAQTLVDGGDELQGAIQSKQPKGVRTAAKKIVAACNSCHTSFR
jgi:hypothetical protein